MRHFSIVREDVAIKKPACPFRPLDGGGGGGRFGGASLFGASELFGASCYHSEFNV